MLRTIRVANHQLRARRHAHSPQRSAQQGVAHAHQLGLQQARNQPQRHANARHRTPAVAHQVQVYGPNAAEGDPGLLDPPIRLVQLDRRDQPRHGGQHQPNHGHGQAHAHHQRTALVGAQPGRHLCGVGLGQASRRVHRLLQAAALDLGGSGVFDLADLGVIEDLHRRRATAAEQALGHGGDEDKQGQHRQDEGGQQDANSQIHL